MSLEMPYVSFSSLRLRRFSFLSCATTFSTTQSRYQHFILPFQNRLLYLVAYLSAFFFFSSFSVVIQEPVGNGMHLSHPGFRRSFTPDTPLALLTSDRAPSPALTSLLCQSDGRARGGRVSVPFSASVLSCFLSLNPLTYEDKGCQCPLGS